MAPYSLLSSLHLFTISSEPKPAESANTPIQSFAPDFSGAMKSESEQHSSLSCCCLSMEKSSVPPSSVSAMMSSPLENARKRPTTARAAMVPFSSASLRNASASFISFPASVPNSALFRMSGYLPLSPQMEKNGVQSI